MSDKFFPDKPNEDIPIVPGMKKMPNLKSPFMKKHGRIFLDAHMINNPEDNKRIVKSERIKLGIGIALIGSVFFNFIQAHYPQRHELLVSLSNETRDIIHTATMPYALNTSLLIRDWATRALCSSMTMTFADYKDVLNASRSNFTDAGYLGFQDAMADWTKRLINEQLEVTVAPHGTTIITHQPFNEEPYWIIQIPIVMTFSAGNDATTRTQYNLATIKVVPVRPYHSIEGHAIDSVLIDNGSADGA